MKFHERANAPDLILSLYLEQGTGRFTTYVINRKMNHFSFSKIIFAPTNFIPSSFWITLKKSHSMQVPILAANEPWTIPPQQMPETA